VVFFVVEKMSLFSYICNARCFTKVLIKNLLQKTV